MKFVIRLLIIALLAYFVPFYTPWWTVLFIGFLVGYLIPGNGFNIFNAGFLGVGLVWLSYTFFLNNQADGILTEKMIALFPLNDANMLLIASAIIGGLCGGFSAVTGNSFRQIFMRKKKKSFYS
jgi:hypothetical protein